MFVYQIVSFCIFCPKNMAELCLQNQPSEFWSESVLSSDSDWTELGLWLDSNWTELGLSLDWARTELGLWLDWARTLIGLTRTLIGLSLDYSESNRSPMSLILIGIRLDWWGSVKYWSRPGWSLGKAPPLTACLNCSRVYLDQSTAFVRPSRFYPSWKLEARKVLSSVDRP